MSLRGELRFEYAAKLRDEIRTTQRLTRSKGEDLVFLPVMWPRFPGASTKRWKDAGSIDSFLSARLRTPQRAE